MYTVAAMMATTNRVMAAKISTVLAALSAAAGSGLLEPGELKPCPQLLELKPTASAMVVTMPKVVRIASSSFDTTTSAGSAWPTRIDNSVGQR
jgi:hypothetical protein